MTAEVWGKIYPGPGAEESRGKGKQCIGASLVFNPDGEEVLQGSFGADAEEIIYTEISPERRPCRGHSWTVRGN